MKSKSEYIPKLRKNFNNTSLSNKALFLFDEIEYILKRLDDHDIRNNGLVNALPYKDKIAKDNCSKNEAIESYIKENIPINGKIKIKFLPPLKGSEIMALMALFWLKKFYIQISPSNPHRNLEDFDFYFLASDATIRAIKFKEIENKWLVISTGKNIIKNSRANAIKDNAKNGAKKRHQANRLAKENTINKWIEFKQKQEEKGLTPSKNNFAEKIYKELEELHKKDPVNNKLYSLKTIRNNWLQGI